MDFENKNQITALFDTVSFGVLTLDNSFNFTYANKKILELLQTTDGKILGKRINVVYPQVMKGDFWKHLKIITKTGEPQDWEYFSPVIHRFLRAHAYKTSNGIIIFFNDLSDKYKLAESLEEKTRLLDLSFDAIFMLDESGKIFYWNKGAEKLYGWKEAHVIGKISYKVLRTEFSGGYEKFFRNLKKKKQWKGTLHQMTKQGKEIIVESTWAFDRKDGKDSIIEINRDITEEYIAKQQILQNERKFRALVESSNDVISITDSHLKIQFVSPSVKRVLHYTTEEFMRKPAITLIHPADWAKSIKLYGELLKNPGKVITDEIRVKDKNGNWHWIESSATNFIDDPYIHGVVSNFRDITEKKNAEQKIHDTGEELETILKNIPSGVIVRNLEGNVVYANQEGVRLSDYKTLKDMLSAPPFEYMYKFDIRDEYGKKFSIENTPGRIALKTGEINQATFHLTNKQSGLSRWVTISAAVIYQGQEKKPLVINVLQDITELKETDMRKNDFISMASHELKTPLTSLKMYMHLLNKNTTDDNEKQNYLAKANDQIEKLQDLVTELLDQSTIQQGRLSLHKQEVYFDFFIREFIQNYQMTMDGFTFKSFGKTDSIVTLDRYRIEQVLGNLLSNAVKYSKERKQATITLLKMGSFVAVTIKDFGIGIPKSELNNIFKPYYRVMGKKENTFPGMGMGLYITKDIIDRHGGEITVDSDLGKGTSVTFTLPIAD